MKTTLIKQLYPTHNEIKYLGMHNTRYCFGIIDEDITATIDRPFYILANDEDEVEEIGMAMFADDSYKSSQFATIERKYGYFEANKILS
jgi:hypothetical protein